MLEEGKSARAARGATPDHAGVYVFDPDVVDWSRRRGPTASASTACTSTWPAASATTRPPRRTSPASCPASEADALLLQQIKAGARGGRGPEKTGLKPILRCDLATEVYQGDPGFRGPRYARRLQRRLRQLGSPRRSAGSPNAILEDNSLANNGGKLGTFNGSHLMAPEVVAGILHVQQAGARGCPRRSRISPSRSWQAVRHRKALDVHEGPARSSTDPPRQQPRGNHAMFGGGNKIKLDPDLHRSHQASLRGRRATPRTRSSSSTCSRRSWRTSRTPVRTRRSSRS